MPLSSLRCCCSGGTLVLTAALSLLLVPIVPDLVSRPAADAAPRALAAPPLPHFSVERLRALCPPLDLFATVIMLVVGFFIYLCEWIQRKIMERRIVKVIERRPSRAGRGRRRGRDDPRRKYVITFREGICELAKFANGCKLFGEKFDEAICKLDL